MTLDVPGLRIVDTSLDPNSPKKVIRYRRQGSRDLYRIRIYLEGRDLPYVKSAVYILHPTFNPQRRKIVRSASNPKCQLWIYTWGIFEVMAKVEMKDGRIVNLSHELNYGAEVNDETSIFVQG